MAAVVAVAAVVVEAVAIRARLTRIPDPINHQFPALVIRLNHPFPALAIRLIRLNLPAPIPIVTARLVSRAWFNCET